MIIQKRLFLLKINGLYSIFIQERPYQITPDTKRVLLYGYDEFSVRKCFYDAFIDKLKKSPGYKESGAAGKAKASYAEFKNW